MARGRSCASLAPHRALALHRGEQAIEGGDVQSSEALFNKAADFWQEAIRLAPTNYIEAQNWLKVNNRFQD